MHVGRGVLLLLKLGVYVRYNLNRYLERLIFKSEVSSHHCMSERSLQEGRELRVRV